MLAKTLLSDRILHELPSLSKIYGKPGRVAFAKRLNVSFDAVKEAFRQINIAQTALICRDAESKGIYLRENGRVLNGDLCICPICEGGFVQKKWKNRTCSRSCTVKLVWLQPGAREKIIAGIQKAKRTPEVREMMRKKNEEQWKDPEFRAIQRESNRRMWSDPERRRKIGEKISAAKSDPAKKAAAAAQLKKRWQGDELRAQVEAVRKTSRWQTNHRNGCIAAAALPENRDRLIAHCKELAKKRAQNYRRRTKDRARREATERAAEIGQ